MKKTLLAFLMTAFSAVCLSQEPSTTAVVSEEKNGSSLTMGTVFSAGIVFGDSPLIIACTGTPITTSGTFNCKFVDQAAPAVGAQTLGLWGPKIGGATGPPTMRASVCEDLGLACPQNFGVLTTSSGGAPTWIDENYFMAGKLETNCWDELYSPGSTGVNIFGCNMAPQFTGTSSAFSQQGSGGPTHPGVQRCTPGTGATDKCGIFHTTMTASIEFGSGPWYYMGTFKLTQKSTNTETFTVFAGFNDSNSALGVDGAVFSYTCNQAAGNCTPPAGDWIATTVSNSTSAGSACDTGVAADTNWHTYEIIVTSAADHAYFYIDHVLKCDNTTNIPTGTARGTDFLPFLIIKSATAGGQPTADLDYYRFGTHFTNPR